MQILHVDMCGVLEANNKLSLLVITLMYYDLTILIANY